MKKCPYCAEDVQDAAIFCKHCRRDIDLEPATNDISAVAESLAATDPAELKVSPKLVAGLLLAAAVVLYVVVSGLSPSGPKPDRAEPPPTAAARAATPARSTTVDGVAEQLAQLSCQCPVSENDTTVLRFRFLLGDLTRTTRLTAKEVGDATYGAQQIAHDSYGKDLALLDLMESARAVVAAAGGAPDYKRALAAVVTQRVR